MKIHNDTTDDALLRELGARLEATRISLSLTQAMLAEQAGLSKRTIERLESGESAAQLSGFLRVCRVLGLLEHLDALIPAPAVSPIAQLKLQGKRRQRVRPKSPTRVAEQKWTWGDS